MARQTRQQRRARRTEGTGGAPPPTPPARPVANGGQPERPERRPAAGQRRPEHARPGLFGRTRGFIGESVGELKKVEWPDQKAVISGTAVVLIACVIVGAYLWANDQVWQYVVQHVLLR